MWGERTEVAGLMGPGRRWREGRGSCSGWHVDIAVLRGVGKCCWKEGVCLFALSKEAFPRSMKVDMGYLPMSPSLSLWWQLAGGGGSAASPDTCRLFPHPVRNCLHYYGNSWRNTGDWCFGEECITFRDIANLYMTYTDMVKIQLTHCYSFGQYYG